MARVWASATRPSSCCSRAFSSAAPVARKAERSRYFKPRFAARMAGRLGIASASSPWPKESKTNPAASEHHVGSSRHQARALSGEPLARRAGIWMLGLASDSSTTRRPAANIRDSPRTPKNRSKRQGRGSGGSSSPRASGGRSSCSRAASKVVWAAAWPVSPRSEKEIAARLASLPMKSVVPEKTAEPKPSLRCVWAIALTTRRERPVPSGWVW
mmetsp:Transcript_23497/g.68680  ORF Transcript_23497/g.68680 Transcript_23497/m.68680 type:complete len:214 (-) Transcript_23497:626-1267(-)